MEEVGEEAVDALVVDEAADDDKLSLAWHLVAEISDTLKGGAMTMALQIICFSYFFPNLRRRKNSVIWYLFM